MEPQDRFETLGVEREGHLTWLTLDRPESLNAMNAALVRELRAFFWGLAEDAETRVVVMPGAGRAFCAGLDLPTIGCAKSRLAGEHGPVGVRRGSWSWLRDGSERLGVVLRTRDGVRPVYVSPGWAIGFRDARALVLATSAGYRLPEPTRRANLLVNALRRGEPTPPPAPPGPASGRAAPASGP